MALYPINLKITGRDCLVVGGGPVAARKISSLLSCGARVRVISPVVVQEIEDLAEAGKVTLKKRSYQIGDIEDSFMVFAATNQSEVQQKVKNDARTTRTLLNMADDPEGSDFHVPASVRRGLLLLTVSTGGGSPAFAKKLRRQMETEFGQEYTILLELFAKVRDAVLADGKNQDEHQQIFQKLIRSDLVEHVKTGDWQSVQTVLEQILPTHIDIRLLLEDLGSGA